MIGPGLVEGDAGAGRTNSGGVRGAEVPCGPKLPVANVRQKIRLHDG